MGATGKYASGTEAWGLCQKCGLRFLLRELVLDDYFPGLRVCESCYDTRQPQEFPISVGDPMALYRPSPEWMAIPSELVGDGLDTSITLFWTETLPQGGPRVDQYDVYRADSTDGVFFSDPVRLIAFPVDYYADFGPNSLADLVDGGNPPAPNHGISHEVLTYIDEGVNKGDFYRYYILARLHGGRLVRSNDVEVQTSHWHFGDAFFTKQPSLDAGTLIFGVTFTSRPYPVQVIEAFHTGNVHMLPSPIFKIVPDTFHAGNPTLVAGTFNGVVLFYTFWPLKVAPDEQFHAGNPQLVAGTFEEVVVTYTFWPLSTVPDEQFHGGNPQMVSGTLRVGLIQYTHWPLAISGEQFHTYNPALTGGTLT